MSQENPKHCKKSCLQCYPTTPRCVTIIYDNKNDFNEYNDVFIDSNEVLLSDDWFPYEFIDAAVNMELDKTKGQLASYEMEKDTKN